MPCWIHFLLVTRSFRYTELEEAEMGSIDCPCMSGVAVVSQGTYFPPFGQGPIKYTAGRLRNHIMATTLSFVLCLEE